MEERGQVVKKGDVTLGLIVGWRQKRARAECANTARVISDLAPYILSAQGKIHYLYYMTYHEAQKLVISNKLPKRYRTYQY